MMKKQKMGISLKEVESCSDIGSIINQQVDIENFDPNIYLKLEGSKTLDEIQLQIDECGSNPKPYEPIKQKIVANKVHQVKDPNKDPNITKEGLPSKCKNVKSIQDGVEFDSNAEKLYFNYNKYVEKKHIERNTTEALQYYDTSGQLRNFYPDFKVDGQFVEIKGVVSSLDECKRRQHPEVKWIVMGENENLFKEMKEKVDVTYKKEWEGVIKK
jgi:hypothetical protein